MKKFTYGTYHGRKTELQGKRALICRIPNSIFVDAQFNDLDTGLGHGWREFYASDFFFDKD